MIFDPFTSWLFRSTRLWSLVALSTILSLSVTRVSQADLMLYIGYGDIGNRVVARDPTSGQYGDSEDYPNLNGTTFTSATGTLNTGVYSKSQESYSFSEHGGSTNLDWTVSEYQDGSAGAIAVQIFSEHIHVTEDQSFKWTAAWDGASTANGSYFYAQLYDETAKINVYFDAGALQNHTGMLLAGHYYSIGFYDNVSNAQGGLGPATSATGHFNFTATAAPSAVPEPSSLSLVAVGGIGMGLMAMRRRRLRNPLV